MSAPRRDWRARLAQRSLVPVDVWSVYVIRTADGALYTGIAKDVARRLAEHRAGRGARFLRGRSPLVLVWKRRVGERGLALRVEWALKRCTRPEKEAIVAARSRLGTLLRRLDLAPIE